MSQGVPKLSWNVTDRCVSLNFAQMFAFIFRVNFTYVPKQQQSSKNGARTLRFITVLTTACHRSLSRANWIHSTHPQPISVRYILIPSSNLCSDLPIGLSPSAFLPKPCTLFSPLPCVPHSQPNPSLFHLPNDIWGSVQIMKFLTVQLLHSPVTSSLLGPNILFRTLLSNTLCLCSSLSVRDQVSHPYKTTGRIMVLF
jgi:hypothetical protein